MALSTAQQYYIENNRDKSIQELVKATGANKRSINTFLKNLPPIEAPKPPKRLKAGDMFVKEAHGGQKGITVMNEAASQIGDSSRSTAMKQGRFKDCIAKIHNDR